MFDDDGEDFDDFWDRHIKGHNHNSSSWSYAMKTTAVAVIGVASVVILCVLLCCCRKRRNRGQILTPPPPVPVIPPSSGPAPYPQQQYVTTSPYPPVPPAPNTQIMVTAYPVGASGYPGGVSAYPAPYPTGHPAAAPYPVAPTAPDHNAAYFGPAPPHLRSPIVRWTYPVLPPTYEQAVCTKQPPYNPNLSQH